MYINSNVLQKVYENRKHIRVDFYLDLYYPLINNESIYKQYDNKKPILIAINLSETGICFKSRAKIHKGDFISFLMKIENNPSFWALCQVKWTKTFENDICIVGCEFYLLTLHQLSMIRKYIINHN